MMSVRFRHFLLVICLAFCVTACALNPIDAESMGATDLIGSSYKAADALSMAATQKWHQPIRQDSPILVATLVNIDTLEASSRLGRLIAEQLQARFSQLGYAVVEVKLRNGTLFVKQDAGELLLSRELKDISTTHHAKVVVVGTYAAARDKVFVNLKMVGDDNVVIGSYDYALAQNNDVRALLMNR